MNIIDIEINDGLSIRVKIYKYDFKGGYYGKADCSKTW